MEKALETTRETPPRRDSQPAAEQGGNTRPVSYRLPKPEAPPLRSEAAPKEASPAAGSIQYGRLVLGAFQASLTLFLTQAAVQVLMANSVGQPVEVRRVLWVIPYIGINTTPDNYISTLSWSTAAAVVATATGTLWNLWRRRDQPWFLMGWASGLLMSLGLLAIQFFRHFTGVSSINPLILGQALAFVLAAGLIFLAFQPKLSAATTSPPKSARGLSRAKETKQ